MSDMSSSQTCKISLTVQYACESKLVPSRGQLRRWLAVALKHDAAVTIRFVNEAEGRMLNSKYRGKDYATNVLTFVYGDLPDLESGAESNVLHGDVVICAPVVEHEAELQQKDLRAHYAHLTIHAVLHLQGYEHENEADAAVMESQETALMLRLHFPDPNRASII
jgi:probable rRNA maturation factor